MPKCLKCNVRDAIQHPTLGYVYCIICRNRNNHLSTPFEFVPESTKLERKKYAKDILQSSRGGVLSKEYIDEYGTDHLKVSPEQIKNARNVWSGETESMPYREKDGTVI